MIDKHKKLVENIGASAAVLAVLSVVLGIDYEIVTSTASIGAKVATIGWVTGIPVVISCLVLTS